MIGGSYRREDIEDILSDPYIQERMSRDGYSLGYMDHPKVSYLMAGEHGCFILIRTLDNELEVHAALKKSSIDVSRSLVSQMIDWVFHHTNVNRIQSPVSSRMMSVVNLCKNCGFSVDGVMRQQELKGGKLYDVYIMSILREDR